jgi:uncharacterized membrane protein
MAGSDLSVLRISSLSDLVFGLALSIGAIALIGHTPQDAGELLNGIIGFAGSFIILINLWMNYSTISAYQRVESHGEAWLNVWMLMGVALEPFLFNLLIQGSSTAGFNDLASQVYAIDLGLVLACQAGMNELTFQKGIHGDRVGSQLHLGALGLGLSATIFFISAAPPFGLMLSFGGLSFRLRYLLWFIVFVNRPFLRRFRRQRTLSEGSPVLTGRGPRHAEAPAPTGLPPAP